MYPEALRIQQRHSRYLQGRPADSLSSDIDQAIVPHPGTERWNQDLPLWRSTAGVLRQSSVSICCVLGPVNRRRQHGRECVDEPGLRATAGSIRARNPNRENVRSREFVLATTLFSQETRTASCYSSETSLRTECFPISIERFWIFIASYFFCTQGSGLIPWRWLV